MWCHNHENSSQSHIFFLTLADEEGARECNLEEIHFDMGECSFVVLLLQGVHATMLMKRSTGLFCSLAANLTVREVLSSK